MSSTFKSSIISTSRNQLLGLNSNFFYWFLLASAWPGFTSSTVNAWTPLDKNMIVTIRILSRKRSQFRYFSSNLFLSKSRISFFYIKCFNRTFYDPKLRPLASSYIFKIKLEISTFLTRTLPSTSYNFSSKVRVLSSQTFTSSLPQIPPHNNIQVSAGL